jgi:hypothetical protein
VASYESLADEVFGIDIRAISKELLLDASECENAFYSLPRLTRDCFNKKGLFNSIEKQILNLHSQKFQYPSASRAVNEMKSQRQRIADITSVPEFSAFLQSIVSPFAFRMQQKISGLDKTDLQMDTLSYIF